jgi:hypothetical protein
MMDPQDPERPVRRTSHEQRAWYVYDFGQSAFSTTVITLFLGPYLTVLAKSAADRNGMLHPLGIAVDARSYWSYLVSLSVMLEVLFLPVIGPDVKRKGYRREAESEGSAKQTCESMNKKRILTHQVKFSSSLWKTRSRKARSRRPNCRCSIL